MKTWLALFIIIATQMAFASGGEGGHGAHGEEGIPVKTITYQAINFGIIVVALVYFLRSKVKTFFAEKRATYVAAAEKTKIARQAAEQEKTQLQVRLSKLQSTADESVQRARAEAADMKNALISEAKALSEKIRKEAETTARLEVERARTQLREKLIHDAVEMARSQIASKVSADDHKRLQDNFISNIQAVQ